MAEGALELAGIEGARFEARLLLSAATGLEAAALLGDPDRIVDVARFRAMVARRAAREPLAYIVGWQEFWSLRFAVSPATLIPRADSETLIEAAVGAAVGAAGAANCRFERVLDLGTGTGCLLLAALTEFPDAWGVGVERNPDAAALARRNAAALGMAGRCAMVAADWAAPLRGRFDLVLSNPPYIETAAVAGLMPEVAQFEPMRALDGGIDGLAAYRAILEQVSSLLTTNGIAILELGIGQAGPVAALAEAAGFGSIETRRDLAGIERALIVGDVRSA